MKIIKLTLMVQLQTGPTGPLSLIFRDTSLSLERWQKVRELIAEAIEFHIEGLREDGEVVPQPSSSLPVQSEPDVSSALITVSV